MNDQKLQIILEVIKKGDAVLNELKSQLGGVKTGVGAVATATKEAESITQQAIGGIKAQWLLLTAKIYAVYFAIQKGFAFAEFAAKIDQAQESFNLAMKDMGKNAEEEFSKIKKATAGILDEGDIYKLSSRAIALGIPIEHIANLMVIARVQGRRMGMDLAEAFNSLATGIGAIQPIMLKDIGIIIDSKKAQEQFGDGIEETGSKAQIAEKRLALLGVVYDEMKDKMKSINLETLSSAETFQMYKAIMDNLKETIGRELLPVFIQFFNFIKENDVASLLVAGFEGVGATFNFLTANIMTAVEWYAKFQAMLAKPLTKNPAIAKQAEEDFRYYTQLAEGAKEANDRLLTTAADQQRRMLELRNKIAQTKSGRAEKPTTTLDNLATGSTISAVAIPKELLSDWAKYYQATVLMNQDALTKINLERLADLEKYKKIKDSYLVIDLNAANKQLELSKKVTEETLKLADEGEKKVNETLDLLYKQNEASKEIGKKEPEGIKKGIIDANEAWKTYLEFQAEALQLQGKISEAYDKQIEAIDIEIENNIKKNTTLFDGKEILSVQADIENKILEAKKAQVEEQKRLAELTGGAAFLEGATKGIEEYKKNLGNAVDWSKSAWSGALNDMQDATNNFFQDLIKDPKNAGFNYGKHLGETILNQFTSWLSKATMKPISEWFSGLFPEKENVNDANKDLVSTSEAVQGEFSKEAIVVNQLIQAYKDLNIAKTGSAGTPNLGSAGTSPTGATATGPSMPAGSQDILSKIFGSPETPASQTPSGGAGFPGIPSEWVQPAAQAPSGGFDISQFLSMTNPTSTVGPGSVSLSTIGQPIGIDKFLTTVAPAAGAEAGAGAAAAGGMSSLLGPLGLAIGPLMQLLAGDEKGAAFSGGGTALGALIGTFLFPGVGTILGGLLGGMGGNFMSGFFEEGGEVKLGDPNRKKHSGKELLALMEEGEYVFSKKDTARIGIPFLDALKKEKISFFEDGGVVGGNNFSDRKPQAFDPANFSSNKQSIYQNKYDVNLNFTIHALDSKSVADYIPEINHQIASGVMASLEDNHPARRKLRRGNY